MKYSRWFLALTLVVAALPAFAAGNIGPLVELKVIKYPQLGQAIKDQKGKVIVVDFWSDT
jgi:hypothetical protein